MRRSSAQHAYEWWCYRIIAYEIGSTPYHVYLMFAKMFLAELDENGERVIRKPTHLTDWEHQMYMEQIKMIVGKLFPKFIWPEPKKMPEVKYRKYE